MWRCTVFLEQLQCTPKEERKKKTIKITKSTIAKWRILSQTRLEALYVLIKEKMCGRLSFTRLMETFFNTKRREYIQKDHEKLFTAIDAQNVPKLLITSL